MSYSFACTVAAKIFRVKVNGVDELEAGGLLLIRLSRVGANHG